VSVTLVKPGGIDTPIAQHAANHMGQEGLIPPPVYDPDLVSQAILDAAEYPRREITVGGIPRLQVLAGTHFPALLDRLSRFLIPMLTDPTEAPTRSDSLASPVANGHIRSARQQGRSVSLYNWVARHRLVATLSAVAIAGGAIALAARAPDES
jgi:hypothetical protein